MLGTLVFLTAGALAIAGLGAAASAVGFSEVTVPGQHADVTA